MAKSKLIIIIVSVVAGIALIAGAILGFCIGFIM
jgi:hypothetical protein